MSAPIVLQAVSRLHTSDRSIGAMLVDAGKLKVADAERILQFQKQEGLRFGEAGIRLGLLKPEDILFALSRQYDYPYLQGDGKVSKEVIAAYQPFSPQVEQLRALRSQLMLRLFTEEATRKALAICSPASGDGRSLLAANLAVVFSQLGEHTLLIDASLRSPRQHHLFRVDNRLGLSSILAGRAGNEAIVRVPELLDLSLLPTGPVPPNPQELLGRSAFTKLIDGVSSEYDVVIIDTPSGEYADTVTIAARTGAALVVARKHVSTLPSLQQLAFDIQSTTASVVGSVLVDF